MHGWLLQKQAIRIVLSFLNGRHVNREIEAVMMFDKVRQVRHNYDHELLQMLLEAEASVAKSDKEDTLIIH